MKPYLSPLAGLLAIVLLSACMSRSAPEPAPTLADRIEQSAQVYVDEASARQAYADRWREGEQIAKAGKRQQGEAEDAIKKAERDQKRAKKELRKQEERLAKAENALTEAKASLMAGQSKFVEGNRVKAAAEAEFHEAFPGALLEH